jgi:WD40 repeat protein
MGPDRGPRQRVFTARVPETSTTSTTNAFFWPLEISTMATMTQVRMRGRPAHTRGPTFLSYTPDGSKLITVGSNNTTRVYKTGFDGEPTNIDDCPEQNTGVASTVSILCQRFAIC